MAQQNKNIYLFYVSNNVLWRHFPNSLLSLSSPLIKAGFNPVIIDTALEGLGKINLENSLFAGFSIYTDVNISVALKVAKIIRNRYPSLPLVWGGPHVIMMPEQTAKHPLVDFACYTEGEVSVVELAKSLALNMRTFQDVPGIIWKDYIGRPTKNPAAGYVDVDKLEVYPYHLLNEKLYNLKHGKIYYEASRGCPYGCKFCSYDHTKWRNRSAGKVIDDLTLIDKKFSPEEIQITDANHFMDTQWVKDIWSGKISRGLKFKWETNCRFDTLVRMSEDVLEVVAKSGCYQIRLGAESGSQEILDYLNKGVKIEQIIKGVELCRRYKINPLISFMVGYPPEEDKEVGATVRLIDLLRKKFPGVQINGLFQFQPYPNTKIFSEISREYIIPQPQSLEGWARYQIIEMHRGDFPWLADEQYQRLVVLNAIVSYIFFSDKIRNMPQGQRRAIPFLKSAPVFCIFKLCDFLIRRTFVYLRWEKKIAAFPIEWYAWNFIRRNILRLF